MAKEELDIDTNTDTIMKTNATTNGEEANTDADTDTDAIISAAVSWHIYLSLDSFLSYFQWYNLINNVNDNFMFRNSRKNDHAYCMDEPLSQISKEIPIEKGCM